LVRLFTGFFLFCGG